MKSISVNGRVVEVDVEDDTPLLWVLRDTLGLTGTKFGCGIGACGSCTVHVDGVPTQSCSIAISDLEGADIRTIESLASDDRLHPVQQAWVELDVPQCGYCQSGQIMTAVALLNRTPEPTDADIDAAMINLCRCGTYQRIRAGVKRAAEIMQG